MYILLIVIGVIIAAVAIFIVYRLIAVKIAQHRAVAVEDVRMKPFLTELDNGTLSLEQSYQYAKNVLTRLPEYWSLKHVNRLDLFPEEFNTIEMGAESQLARWLEFPTELDKCPDEIEYFKKVTLVFGNKDEDVVHYHVFRFKTYEPHWAAKDGWSFGVVGPYFDNSKPYGPATAFSRIGSSLSAEEEAAWVHQNIVPRTFPKPS